MIDVMLVDDDPVIRDGYRRLITAQPDLRVVGEAGDGAEACRTAPAVLPDVLLMDLHMPSMDGVEAARRIAARAPSIKILVVTVIDHPEDVRAAVQAGAAGFVVKNGPLRELLRAIRLVHAGRGILSPEVTGGLMELVRGTARDPDRREFGNGRGETVRLTGRESETLRLVAEGGSNAEIAAELFLSPASVKTYVSRLLAKLGVRTRAELVSLYYAGHRAGGRSSSRARSAPSSGPPSSSQRGTSRTSC